VRLIELVDAWQGCLELAVYLSDPAQTPSADIRAAATQIGPKPMHTDPAIAFAVGARSHCRDGDLRVLLIANSMARRRGRQ